MENKTEPYLIVFLCGLADAVTTQIGLNLGFTERNPFSTPFLATLIYIVVFLIIDREEMRANQTLKEIIKAALVLSALSPCVNNLLVIFSAVLR